MYSASLLESTRMQRPNTLAAIVEERAADSADRPFLTCGTVTLTYGEFGDKVSRVAAGLRELGIRRGDKVCLFLPNGIPLTVAMFAVARIGATFVCAHADLRARELRHVLAHSDAVAVFTDTLRLPSVQEVRTDCPLLRHVVLTDAACANGAVSLDELLQSAPDSMTTCVDTDAPAGILYTSGTTGVPKGVLLKHAGYLLNAQAIVERTSLTRDDVLYCVLPLAHLNAQRSSLLPAAMVAAHLVLDERFSASAFWPAVRSHGVTFFSLMPAIVSILVRQQVRQDDREHSVRLCVTPITPALLDAFESRFGIPVLNTYGLTEGMLNVMNFQGVQRRPGAVGKPLLPEIHRVRIVDEADRDVPAGSSGEILLQSPAMMIGYHKDPAATQMALRGGWLHTGDLGFLDDEGFLHFSGRRKELIRRGGENVAPAEIESVLAEHPAVQEAVAVGVPDPVLEEEIKACVILRDERDASSVPPEELFAHCVARLAPFKVPRYIEYRRDFPRTPTLRVERHKLTTLNSGSDTVVYDRTEKTS